MPVSFQGPAGGVGCRGALVIAFNMAYNAGESRVDRWLSKARSIPMDVWIETIPFSETRNYVQNVLAFEVVYRELEQRSAPVLRGSEWVTPAG